MPKPNPIIEMAVRIQAISVLSPAMMVRWRATSVRSSARNVPLSFGTVSVMGPFSSCFIAWGLSRPSDDEGTRQVNLKYLQAAGLRNYGPKELERGNCLRRCRASRRHALLVNPQNTNVARERNELRLHLRVRPLFRCRLTSRLSESQRTEML